MWRRLKASFWLVMLVLMSPLSVGAQPIRGIVVDQTGLPLPAVRLEVSRGDRLIETVTSGPDGHFELSLAGPEDFIEATLHGFEPARVPATQAARIVLTLERESDQTEATASALTSSGVAMDQLGSVLTPAVADRMPTARPSALAELPLLPSVIRGPDGLLRLDGTRPHEAALWLDGFDVTDPVTGVSDIDLPLEAIKGVAVLRDPMDVSFGGSLGALASMETIGGGDSFSAGVQGFVPRPRLNPQGFGRIEGFFPRAYVSGQEGRIRYFAAESFGFDRVAVPGVTTPSGGNVIGDIGATSFARVDIAVSPRQTATLEGLFVPGQTANLGLSSLIAPTAAPTVRTRDMFGGFTDRVVLDARDVFTVRVGTFAHGTILAAKGSGPATVTPLGWVDNSFSTVHHWATRQTVAAEWARSGIEWLGAHTLTLSTQAERRAMEGAIADEPLQIEDAAGQLVRLIEFNGPAALAAADRSVGSAVHDLWQLGPRVDVDLGIRLDWDQFSRQAVPSPRVGVKYLLDADGNTVVRGGVGQFVGFVPLDALAFGSFPSRTDTSFDPATGLPEQVLIERPTLTRLAQPRADTVVLELDRRLRPGLDLEVGARTRSGSQLPTVDVPANGGAVTLESTGVSTYRELQATVRESWAADQVFVSYVRSASRVELNDFGSLFANMDAPQLEPGGQSVGTADVPNRVIAWGTVLLPRQFVVSPRVDWHTGFPYSALDVERHYLGEPDGLRFPDFFSLDVVIYKIVEVRARRASLGLQIFNLTGHFNPRDVMAVAGVPQFGQFANNIGVTLGGYFKVNWQ